MKYVLIAGMKKRTQLPGLGRKSEMRNAEFWIPASAEMTAGTKTGDKLDCTQG
jgi:hypothetical protein